MNFPFIINALEVAVNQNTTIIQRQNVACILRIIVAAATAAIFVLVL